MNLVLVDQEKNIRNVVENYKKINKIVRISITKEDISILKDVDFVGYEVIKHENLNR